MWGFGSFYQCPGGLEHSSTPTGQQTRRREEKQIQGLISNRGCHRTTGGRIRGSLKKERLQKPSRRATRPQRGQITIRTGWAPVRQEEMAAHWLVRGRRGEGAAWARYEATEKMQLSTTALQKGMSRLSRGDTHGVWFRPGWEEQAAVHCGGYTGRARLAGRGREEVPSGEFPTSDGWAGSKPTQQPITLRRRELRAGSLVCAAMGRAEGTEPSQEMRTAPWKGIHQ